MTPDESKLLKLQEFLASYFGCKVDVYRQEGKGVLTVKHNKALHPFNVIFQMDDLGFQNIKL